MVGSEAQAKSLVVQGKTQERNSGGDAKDISKSSNKDRTCRYCKKRGHIKSKCYKLQNKNKKAVTNQKGKQLEKSGENNVEENEYSHGELIAVSNGDSKPYEDWILDSSCTFHMCHNQD